MQLPRSPELMNSRFLENSFTPEMMGGVVGDFFVSTGKTIVSPFVAIGKGTGHIFGEIGRGFSRGDPGRVLAAPFRGLAHSGATQFRAYSRHAEFYYRPSKMGWMQPIGGLISAAGLIPTPASPFLLAIGGGMATVGTVATANLERERAEKQKQAFIQNLKEQLGRSSDGKINWPVWLSLGATGIGTFLVLKGIA